MQHIKKTLDAFLAGESRVFVIKGAWGVGKTYFWEKYIAERIKEKDLKQAKYSYTSLFGNSSLKDIKKSVYYNARAVDDDSQIEKGFNQEFPEPNLFFNQIARAKEAFKQSKRIIPYLRSACKHLKHIQIRPPMITISPDMASSIEYALVKKYIICIDDIERKAKNLSIADVMGLVDELAQRKACKVILIFNEDELDDNDKIQFEKYREKVVDHEIHYNPTSKENLAYIFDTKAFSRYAVLEDAVCKLDIKNIRILRNIKNICDVFHRFINEKDDKIIDEFILHATLLSKFYYAKDEELPYDILKHELANRPFEKFLVNDKENLSPPENKYKDLALYLKFRPSPFDSHISFFLENGYIENEEALKEAILQLEENIKVNSVQSKISRAWDIYGDSFKDNYDDFKLAMLDILDNGIVQVEFGQLDSILDILEMCGENISPYIDRYFELNSENLNIDVIKPLIRHEKYGCKQLIDKFEEFLMSNKTEEKKIHIDDIISEITNNVECEHNLEYIDYLSLLSANDYIKWMKTNPDNLYEKIERALLYKMIHPFKADTNKIYKIGETTKEALKLIAAENEFNKIRVQSIYGIKLDDSDT